MKIRDSAIKYGDNVDTDVIIPARYLNTTNEKELALHCFEDLDKDFTEKVKERKIIIAGENFGCGSSREHAPLSIKASGVKLIIAKSFARIFFRNAINIGLPLIISSEASENIKDGDLLEVDFDNGIIKNLTSGEVFKTNPYPEFIQNLIGKGGYVNYVKSRFEREA